MVTINESKVSVIFGQRAYRLTRKASERMRWWSNQRWSSVIVIIPELEKEPLWSRSEENLATIRLYKLTPKELGEKLQQYWQKPIWQQWLFRLFTSVGKQTEIWSYYQHCLALCHIKQEKSLVLHNLSVAMPRTASESILENLGVWFSEKEERFEQLLNKQSVHRLKKNFHLELQGYTAKIGKKFAKKLKRELSRLPPDSDPDITQKECWQAYQDVMQILSNYWWKWYRATYLQSTGEYSLVPVAGSSTVISVQQHSIHQSKLSEEEGLSFLNMEKWIHTKREQIRTSLEKKDELAVEKLVPILLAGHLKTVSTFVAPQLHYHQQLIANVLAQKIVLERKVDYENALQAIQNLQSRLLKFYRQTFLLFHPDHYHDLFLASNPILVTRWNEIFVAYKQHIDTTLVELEAKQNQLKRYLGFFPSEDLGVIIAELQQTYEKLVEALAQLIAERHAFYAEMKKELEKLKMKMEKEYAQDKMEWEQLREQDKLERQVKLQKQDEIINQLSQAVNYHIFLTITASSQSLENSRQEDTSASSPQFLVPHL